MVQKEMDMMIQVQNLDEAVCISHCVNTLGGGGGGNAWIQLQLNNKAD